MKNAAQKIVILRQAGYAITSGLHSTWTYQGDESEDFVSEDAAWADAWGDAIGRTMGRRNISSEQWDALSFAQQKELVSNLRAGQPDEPPRTFGCHHVAETCPLCEGLVNRWKAEQGLG